MHVKYNVMQMLFAGKNSGEILSETGISQEELELIKSEISESMRSKWGFKE
jgi:hypothetical protein